ncbi:MAG: hypothetical protein U9Q74_12485 [Gemmatimonadota bacterium]|nr:hypothetical protein [Gemmatimonadota bacterium]
MVSRRAGKSSLGCLASTLLVAAVAYFGVTLGQVLWDYYQFEDAMKQEVRFSSTRSDAVIKRRLEAFADSLGLPEAARNVHIKRSNKVILIWAEYYHNIELPGFVKEIRFSPQATGPF